MHLPRRLVRRVGGLPLRRRRADRAALDLFTDRARDAMGFAQDEARRLGHNYLGTEHLLLGLVRKRDGVAGKVLRRMGVRLPAVRSAVESVIGRGAATAAGEMRMTPRAKKVLDLAVKESGRLRHNYVGTEHLLLGIVREGEGVAAGILGRLGVTHEKVRAEVLRMIGPGPDGGQRDGSPRLGRAWRGLARHDAARHKEAAGGWLRRPPSC